MLEQFPIIVYSNSFQFSHYCKKCYSDISRSEIFGSEGVIINACHVLIARLLSVRAYALYSFQQYLKVPHLDVFKKQDDTRKKFSFVWGEYNLSLRQRFSTGVFGNVWKNF